MANSYEIDENLTAKEIEFLLNERATKGCRMEARGYWNRADFTPIESEDLEKFESNSVLTRYECGDLWYADIDEVVLGII